ncbi:MAG: 3-dehydroquinate synthase [bacterium]|nr:3-dehydroquinate synthase [bacterium]
MEKILVKLKEESYPIFLTREGLEDIGSIMRRLDRLERVTVITDSQVEKRYLDVVEKGFRVAGYQVDHLVIPAGEESKSLEQAGKIYDRLLELGVNRQCGLAALGGGVVGDLTGFVAATYLRGIDYIQIPTTVIAQVDAAIGGKTGVNLPQGKNLVGSFWHPRMVFCDIEVLKTLEQKEFVAGLAEVIKYGIIMDEKLFVFLEENIERVLQKEMEDLLFIVRRSARDKAQVVKEDERELTGKRTILNFGHTIGHALEASARYRGYRHGEAVAIGMASAARLSERLGFCKGKVKDRIVSLIQRAGLPTEVPELDEDDLVPIISMDKKATAGLINFVVVEDIGKVRLEKIEPGLIGENFRK